MVIILFNDLYDDDILLTLPTVVIVTCRAVPYRIMIIPPHVKNFSYCDTDDTVDHTFAYATKHGPLNEPPITSMVYG